MSNSRTHNPFLVFNGKDEVPYRIEILGPVFAIGRAPENDLQIQDTVISRRHAEIAILPDQSYVLRDRDSKSGTYVNGKRITEHLLGSGDEIVLGDDNIARFTFQFPDIELVSIPTIEAKPPFELRITDRQTRFLNHDLMGRPEQVTVHTVRRLAALYRMMHTLVPVQTIDELCKVWLDAVFNSLPAENAGIMLYNPATKQIELVASRTRTGAPDTPIGLSNTIVEQTFQDNVAILTKDATRDARFSAKDSIIIQNIRSVLTAPIGSAEKVWGICYLSNQEVAQFDSEDLEFLMATARQAGLVLEKIRLVEELRATQEQLIKSERMATIGKLTSSISHELRNRLGLLSAAEFIDHKYGDNPEVKQFTDIVMTGQRRALALVEEIREFARNRSVNFNRECLPIVPTIQRTISLLRYDPIVSRREVRFDYSATPGLFYNVEKFEQVLINLIRNAAEATTEETGHISVALEVEGQEVVIRVTDNGTGMPPEVLRRIWEPFFTTKGEEGTGLGLEICRRIVEAHQGRITCESSVGMGSTFTIRLPLDVTDVSLSTTADLVRVDTASLDGLDETLLPDFLPRLRALPKDWRRALNQAVTQGDVEMANQLLDQIEPHDAVLSANLREFVRGFRFDEIQTLLEEAAG